ncbi:MAG: nucleotidyltransferase family protein [Eubacteriales bacterium]|nr:nucleotidyltransferase family protein [Eubacteriales bacterium]
MINNKKVVGIVVEYDPFHNGHYKQIERAKEITSAEYVCVIMSGPFMQRGTMSMFSPYDRAEMAVRNNVDVVLELPTYFSLRDAKGFAFGAIYILHSLGIVDYISFGCEAPQIDLLWSIAKLLHTQNETVHAYTQTNIGVGKSYVANQSEAIGYLLGEEAKEIYSHPNNMLAIQYLCALLQLNSPIEVVPILREGAFHSKEMNPLEPSASFIRYCILKGNVHQAMRCLPAGSIECIEKILLTRKWNQKQFADEGLLIYLKTTAASALVSYPGVSEGLENKIHKHIQKCHSADTLLQAIKSRRFTQSRLQRLFSYVSLGITKQDLETHHTPAYTRVLAYKNKALPLVRALKNANINVIMKSKLYENLLLQDKLAYAMWETCAKTDCNFISHKIFHI